MKYKYKKGQLFGKSLKVSKSVMNKIYNCTLTLEEYVTFNLIDKIPITCIKKEDRDIVEKFGIDKCRDLDWDLINREDGVINVRNMIMSIDSKTEDINLALYELVKDIIRPNDYSSRMKKEYSGRLIDISPFTNNRYMFNLVYNFNNGSVNLNSIILNWDFFKDKDLSFCLSHDNNSLNINQGDLESFMNKYGILVNLAIKYDDVNLFLNSIKSFQNEEEKNAYIKSFTDALLEKSKKDPDVNLSNEEYREIFKYSSFEDHLKNICRYNYNTILNELNDLPEDYVYNMPIPLSNFFNSNVLSFVKEYGLKNVVDFDNECGHFFTNNDCEMLKLMYDMYLHYAGNEHDPSRSIYTKKTDDDYDYNRLYTKDEFYEAMKRMIIYGPSDWDYRDKAPDYRSMIGEFRVRNKELFISDDAPEELKQLFYTKSIPIDLLVKHPEYIEFLRDKDLSSCLIGKSIQILENQDFINIYKFLSSKTDFDGVMNFIIEYSDVLNIVFDRKYYNIYDNLRFSINDDISNIQDKVDDFFRRLIIEHGIVYPKKIPEHFKKKYPTMFLTDDAPKDLQDAFYSRKIDGAFIVNNPSYLDIIKKVDLELLYKYMPVTYLDEFTKKRCNIVTYIKDLFGLEDGFDTLLLYGKYIEKTYEYNSLKSLVFNSNFSKDDFLDSLDKCIYQAIIDGKLMYDETMPSHFKNNYPTLFLDQNIDNEIKNKFYNRKFTVDDFINNPILLDIFGTTNIICGLSEIYAWAIPVFSDSSNNKALNYKRLKLVGELIKIQDYRLEKVFKDFILNNVNNIDIEKIECISEVLRRLSLSNSTEISNFSEELAIQILNTDNPLESLQKIEDMFIRNNIPVVGKIYSCFEILHPNFQGFNFDNSMVSPVLNSASMTRKKIVVFSDLIKCAFGSNNLSVNEYIRNIEVGSGLFEKIRSGEIEFQDLSLNEQEELITFSKHLATLYNNTRKSITQNDSFIPTGDVINDIMTLSSKLSTDGSLDYNLGDRVIRMFCGFAGIDTVEQAKHYIDSKVESADLKNRTASQSELELKYGDFVKGIGDIKYLRNILQNGSVAKEYLGASSSSDATPLDTDLSMIISDEGTIRDRINSTAAYNYGPIYFVLKNNDRFITTRTNGETLNTKRDMTKMEVFYTGVLGDGHYGMRTGFASSEIDYIVMENYDSRVGLEIAMNGFYIPVANMEGKIVFTPDDYDKIRSKMNGLSYYGINEYIVDESKSRNNFEISSIISQMNDNMALTEKKSKLVWTVINNASNELGLVLKNKIDLNNGSLVLFNTGSTGRFTNLPGDGDFDYTMQVDKSLYSSQEGMSNLRKSIIKHLANGKDIKYDIVNGDIRELKTTVFDEEGNEHEVEVDITFTVKTDKVEYASDVCVSDRLNNIKDSYDRNIVKANIILAKQLLKGVGAYKPARKYPDQGGLGGIGVENWILQNGGTLYSAAKSFLDVANECTNFEEFKNKYSLPNFGINHMAVKRDSYPHDNYIDNMNEIGYEKIKNALRIYLEKCEAYSDNPVLETIESVSYSNTEDSYGMI